MYTLNKAKEEIDNVAKHATDLAVHVIGMSDEIDSKLERFKQDILSTIESKFAALARDLHGDAETVETTAVSDLAAKVSLLTRGPQAVPAESGRHEPHASSDQEPPAEPHHEAPAEPLHDQQAPSGDQEWTQGYQPDHHPHQH